MWSTEMKAAMKPHYGHQHPSTEVAGRIWKETGWFTALTFAFTWSLWIPAARHDLHLAFLGVGACGPSVAALCLVAWSGGWQRVRDLIAGAVPRRAHAHIYAAALGIPLVIIGSGFIVASALPGTHLTPVSALPWPLVPLYLVLGLFVFGPLQEEFGWRGYALPRLLQRVGVAAASLLLGIIWAIWHLPLFFHGDTFQADIPFWAFAISTVASSVIYTCFFLAEGGRLTGALLLHASSNTVVLALLTHPAQRGSTAPFITSTGITILFAVTLLIRHLHQERHQM